MKVHIRTNVLDDFIGLSLTLNLPERACLQSLFDTLVQDYGKQIEQRLFPKGKLYPSMTILVNGCTWSFSDLQRELPQPCEIRIIQMLCGG